MSVRDGISSDIWDIASAVATLKPVEGALYSENYIRPLALVLQAERERWKAAVTYFERYCQDEAEDVENCVCGQQQHEDAKAFAAVALPCYTMRHDRDVDLAEAPFRNPAFSPVCEPAYALLDPGAR